MSTLTDRSRILNYRHCKRERFLTYHCQTTGITTTRLDVNLSTGSAIHSGIEQLLLGKTVDNAVLIAIQGYTELVSMRELEIDDRYEDQLFVFEEQKALIEALIRVYEKIQLPKLLAEYEVLEVEKEIVYELVTDKSELLGGDSQGLYTVYKNNSIILMSKPDAILRDKSTKGLVVYSLKSSSSWNDTNEKQNKYDDQGISELIATESLYNEEVEAIKMEFLLKGSRTLLSDGMGGKVKLQNTFLIHPYMLDSGFQVSFSIKYTKAKGWNRVNIWEVSTVKEWIDYLYNNHYEALEGGYVEGEKEGGVIVTPYPYNRSTADIEDWLDQNRYQEKQIVEHLSQLKGLSPTLVGPRELDKPYRKLLNQYFPQTRNACFSYGRHCQFINHCWEGSRTDSLEFIARTPHHETELNLIQISKGE